MSRSRISGEAGKQNRRFYIKTYGCQMNVHDSDRIADHLVAAGHCRADTLESADIIILNTCHIREKATEKVFSELGRIRRWKADRGGKMAIAVAGCVAQAEGAEIIRRQPAVDMVVGPQAWHHFPEMLESVFAGGSAVVEIGFEQQQKFAILKERAQEKQASAFLSVQEGCDKFCAFCVVPYTRGAETSRCVSDIGEEARNLAGSGVRELTLLGQNVNAWRGQDREGKRWDLARLLGYLSTFEGLERLRYTTSHPRDMSASLIAAHGEVSVLAPYLHLPVQSGSDRILKAMNRGHSARYYLDILEELRVVRPDMAFSSDFIVGFPGETEADFADTLVLAEQAGYASAYSFKYSPRPGTPGAEMPDQVDADIASERLSRLQAVLERQKRRFNVGWLGRRLRVLLTGPGQRPGQLAGRSEHMQAVHVEADEHYLGKFADIDIIATSGNSLTGKLCAGEARA